MVSYIYCLFSPLPGGMIQFDDHILFKWVAITHQLDYDCHRDSAHKFRPGQDFSIEVDATSV